MQMDTAVSLQYLITMLNDYQLNNIDKRTHEQKENDMIFVKNLTKRNLEAFKIRLTERTRRNYNPKQLIRLEFQEGWFCYVTDNSVKSAKTILTFHGSPGNHVEWAGLEHEMGEYCRWINFIVPGFDGEDERRGTYDGRRHQVFQLIVLVLDRLKINKAIVCAHSFGSTYSPQLIKTYPHRFQGYINITGIEGYWNHGFLTLYSNITVSEGFCQMAQKGQSPWNDQKQRLAIYQRFKQRIEQQSFAQIKLKDFLTISEYFSFLKLTVDLNPNQMDNLIKEKQNLPFLRVLFYGNMDPYILSQLGETTICRLAKQNRSDKEKILAIAGKSIEERLRKQFGIEIQGSKIQEYLCFMFDKTGHTVHRRRPEEVSKIIKIYIACLETIDRFLPLQHTSL